MSLSLYALFGNGALLLLAIGCAVFIASASLLGGLVWAVRAAGRVVLRWLRERAARRIITERNARLRAEGSYFSRQRAQQVVTRTTSTSEPAAPLPSESREAAKRDIDRASFKDACESMRRGMSYRETLAAMDAKREKPWDFCEEPACSGERALFSDFCKDHEAERRYKALRLAEQRAIDELRERLRVERAEADRREREFYDSGTSGWEPS